MTLELAVLIVIFTLLIIARYILGRKTRRRFWKPYSEVLKEQKVFLDSFNASLFNDFSAFDFERGSFSHVSPFPNRISGEWRYRIYLEDSEPDDVVTVVHEISECTVGRIMEKLLNLEKPLYLYRKGEDKFWIHGKKQKYVVEHVLTTFGEVDDLPPEILNERFRKEDIKAWLNSDD